MAAKTDKSFHAVQAFEKLLLEIKDSKDRTEFDDIPLDALSRQSRFAALSVPNRGLIKISVNTMKSAAEDYIEGGFTRLNSLRELAHELLRLHRESVGRPGRDTKASLRGQVRAKDLELATRDEDLKHLTGALRAAIGYMKQFAENSNNPSTLVNLGEAIKDVLERAAPSSAMLAVVK